MDCLACLANLVCKVLRETEVPQVLLGHRANKAPKEHPADKVYQASKAIKAYQA